MEETDSQLLALAKAFFECLIVFLAVVTGFHTLEAKLFPAKFRSWLSQIIRFKISETVSENNAPPRTLAEVLLSSTHFFDWLFGKRHWTRRCMFASGTFTIIFSSISFVSIFLIAPGSGFEILSEVLFDSKNIPFLLIALFFNFFIDYLSLWETRRIIGMMNKDGSWFGVIILLIADTISTYAIFLIGISILKTSIDLFYLMPLIYRHEVISVRSIPGIDVTLTSADGLIANVAAYFWTTIQVSFNATMTVLGNLRQYWTLTLYISEETPYIIPASTLWATTHLSTMFIVIYILIWATAKHLTIFKTVHLPQRMLPSRLPVLIANFDAQSEPVTIFALNVTIWSIVIYLLYKIYALW